MAKSMAGRQKKKSDPDSGEAKEQSESIPDPRFSGLEE
jgi:hypothetical protein